MLLCSIVALEKVTVQNTRPEYFTTHNHKTDRLCGIVVGVPDYRSRGPGSITGGTSFSDTYWVWNGVHSASWVQLRSYFEERVAAPVMKIKVTALGIRKADHAISSIRKTWH
jgi:hypothetical protein